MEGRMCKICNKVFSNGRALGGHMRSHLVTLPLPLKKPIQLQLSRTSTESTTSATISSDEEREIDQEKILMYGLRENPKRSFRMADPEFLDHGGSGFAVQEDRESETEVTRKTNPTRKRSKRARVTRLVKEQHNTSSELEPVMSSVSDQISAEEDVALCLMMLSRDVMFTFGASVTRTSRVVTRSAPSTSARRVTKCLTRFKHSVVTKRVTGKSRTSSPALATSLKRMLLCRMMENYMNAHSVAGCSGRVKHWVGIRGHMYRVRQQQLQLFQTL